MNFIVDANLPRRLAHRLHAAPLHLSLSKCSQTVMTKWERIFFTFLYRLPLWARWSLLLPGAFVADYITQSFLRIFFFILALLFLPKSLLPYINFLNWQAFAPFVFVVMGVQIAPSRKFVVAAVLGGIKIWVAIVNIHTAYTYIIHGGSWLNRSNIVSSPLWWNICVFVFCIAILLGFMLLVLKLGDREPVIE